MNVLRRIIAFKIFKKFHFVGKSSYLIITFGSMDAIEFINSKLKSTKNNSEFFNSMNKPS